MFVFLKTVRQLDNFGGATDKTIFFEEKTFHLKETDIAPKLMPLKSFAFSKAKMNPEMKMDE